MTNMNLEIKDRTPLLLEMENYASEHDIPIMELDGMETMLKFMEASEPKKVLEIGTAIGYSALRMIDRFPMLEVVTMERNAKRIELARQFIERAGKNSQVTILEGDALLQEEAVEKLGMYDCLFIDAAKGQYQHFFEMYEKFVKPGGIVFSDNVLFKGLVDQNHLEEHTKRKRQLIQKIQNYNFWLSENKNYETVILRVGDGLAVSCKKK